MALRLKRAWMVSAALAVVLGTALPASAEEAISEEAKLYFRNGVELIQSSPPNYQDAYYQFKLAYEKSKSWKVLGNLGLCSFKLERDGEALEAYQAYLKSGGNEIDPEERKQLERDVLVITGNSAAVNLVSSVPDVEVVDMRAGTSVPPQTYKFTGTSLALRLRAGSHTLTATTPDGKQQRWEVQLSPGKTIEHRFTFETAPVAVAPPLAAAPPPNEPPPADSGSDGGGGGGLRTVGFITLGVGGAALIGGVVTGIMAKGKEDDATGQCQGKVCPTAAEKDFDSASSLAGVSTVLYIGGGVLAAAGLGMVVFGGGSSEKPATALQAPRLELSPYVGKNGAGFFAAGAF